MPTIREMSEAHLVNVEREIQTLQQKGIEIKSQIEQLTSYLEEGKAELLKEESLPTPTPSFSPTVGL